MPQDNRLARLLHVVLHMHLLGGATTSATLAQMLHTNPVVVRRTMAALRDAGYVISYGGRGGGWCLTDKFAKLTVADIYSALDSSGVFSFGLADDNPSCPVEGASNRFLLEAMSCAEQVLREQFASKKLTDLIGRLDPVEPQQRE